MNGNTDWKTGLSDKMRARISIASRIEAAEDAARLRREADERMKTIRNCTMTDISRIPEVYGLFRDAVHGHGISSDRFTLRREFIFIVLALYSPASLSGVKMPNGLRSAIAGALGVDCPGTVSISACDLLFTYRNYRSFRDEVDAIYDEIVSRLQ